MAKGQGKINLSGYWHFTTAPVSESMLSSVKGEKIFLPGSMLTNGNGDEVSIDTKWTCSLYDSSYYHNPYMEKYRQPGHLKFPFFLTPAKHYVGPAWYWTTVRMPATWRNKRIILFLERPHIETTLYVNGQQAGHQLSLSTPHQYDITPLVDFGKTNRIAIQVYNGIENVGVGRDSHSVTDQTQGNWNGIVGKIELLAKAEKSVERIRVGKYDEVNHSLQVELQGKKGFDKSLRFFIDHRPVRVVHSQTVVGKPDVRLYLLACSLKKWDEFHPQVYQLGIVAREDTSHVQFGVRDIAIKGRQFYMNGSPMWIRGTVENCDFPLTGYPPTDVDSWLAIFRKCKAYGLNAMRFHSYCPPEAAFTAADRVGFYLQPEGPSWPNHGVKLGQGMKIDTYLKEETKRIVDAYGNHPSFVMMAAANEPAGNWVKWCDEWVKEMKQYDPRRVYCGASVGGGWAWDSGSDYHVKGGARGLDWNSHAPQSEDDYLNDILHPRHFTGSGENDTPMIAHEQGQWCAFPDLKERSQYTGVYKARNFDIFADLLHDHGIATMAGKFLSASGKLQVLSYKYEIERNLRTKDYSGFFLLGLNDYSGQGTALVGPLNVFWKEKGYVTAPEWREFCSPIVPLARFPKFIFSSQDTIRIPVEMYNAYFETFQKARTSYTITENGDTLSLGLLRVGDIPVGKNFPLGTVVFQPSQLSHPTKLTLTVSSVSDSHEESQTSVGRVKDQWDFWVYPPVALPHSDGVYVSDTLDAKAISTLRNGGKVLLIAAGKIKYGDDVKQTYLPIFWNTSWFKMRPPHTTGSYIQNDHPVFAEFPTDNWQNLNWWELVNKAQVMNLSAFPLDYQPIVQPIDTWHISRKLGMLFEAKVLNGRLMMTTIDLSNHLDTRLVARQLLKSVLDYMDGPSFNPSLSLPLKTISDLFEKEAPRVDMYTNDSPDELKPKLN
jgi:hypothetical protein